MTDSVANISIRMTAEERALFERSLEGKPIYLEFGCGGSTEIAVAKNCPMIVSIDSDPEWIARLREKPQLAERVKKGSLIFEHVDIGPVGDWGVPKDSSMIRNWPNYPLAPFKRPFEYGFVFIDGRFRNACAYASWVFMMDHAKLAVHDYTVRKEYYDIEKFFEMEEIAGTLVIFRKKKGVVIQNLYTSMMTHLFQP